MEAPSICDTPNISNEVLQSKKYELKLGEDIYSLLIETNSDNKIIFKLRKSNNLSLYHSINKYYYEQITKLFFLHKEHYKDLNKVFHFFDLSLTKNKINFEFNKEGNIIILKLKKILDFDEIECKLELYNEMIPQKEMFCLLIDEINEIKNNKKENNEKNDNNIINELSNKNKEYENRIKILEEKIITLENEFKKYKEHKEKMLKELDNKLDDDFKENPKNLKYKKELTNNRSEGGVLRNFDVFKGLKDNVEYMIYNNNNTYNLDIMRIKDQFIIKSLIGHNNPTTVISYYLKNNQEYYFLSCEKNNLTIIWDIQNDFNKKYLIKSSNIGTIFGALLLFNIYNKDYLVLSSRQIKEYSKLYEFKDKTPFVKDIYGTNNNDTAYMILWYFNNEYYLIECCRKKISINNILKEENYANFFGENKSDYYCGYIYKKNLLCVSDYNNSDISIWDLINKTIYKKIIYDSECGREIIPWNHEFAILACYGCFVIINIEKGFMVEKIEYNKSHDLMGVKKIIINNLGECLICSRINNCIGLFCVK